MSEYDDGLTMEQASPDLNDGIPETAVDDSIEDGAIAEIPQEETPAEKPKTKQVSDRINEIRAESNAQIEELKRRLEESNNQLLAYRANEEGISVEELMNRDRMQEQSFKDAMHSDPEFLALQQRDFERQKKEVLTQLQEAFPNDGVDNLDALPSVFFRQLQAGVDPVTAYRASVAASQKETPPSTGSVRSQGETPQGDISEEQALSMDTNDWIQYLNAHDE